MEARAITGKRARVLRFLRAAARHVLIDLFLAELVVAGFLIGRLPVPVRPVRLDATDFATLTITETAGAWPSQSLTLDGQEKISAYCEQLNALRAPRDRRVGPRQLRCAGLQGAAVRSAGGRRPSGPRYGLRLPRPAPEGIK